MIKEHDISMSFPFSYLESYIPSISISDLCYSPLVHRIGSSVDDSSGNCETLVRVITGQI